MGRMSFTQELAALAKAGEGMDAGGCWREARRAAGCRGAETPGEAGALAQELYERRAAERRERRKAVGRLIGDADPRADARSRSAAERGFFVEPGELVRVCGWRRCG